MYLLTRGFIITALAVTDGTIRINGSSPTTGRVEVYYNGEWGTICDDAWDIDDAKVVCRQLGFQVALQAYSGATHGEGTGPIWIDDVACSGSESHLYDCRHRGWGNHDCTHSRDVSVKCASNVRLGGMVQTTMAGSKFITTDNGARCVMICGTSMTRMWFVVSSVTSALPQHPPTQRTVRDLILSGWMMFSATEGRLRFVTALITEHGE